MIQFVWYIHELIQWYSGELNSAARFFVSLLVVIFITCLNIVGIEIVGVVSVLFTILVLSPFVVLGMWGIPHIQSSAITSTPSFAEGHWGLFLSVILWNTAGEHSNSCFSMKNWKLKFVEGWNSVGSVAGSVSNPAKTYPRGMMISVLLVVVSYIWPLAGSFHFTQTCL